MAIEIEAQGGERITNNPEGKTKESNKEQLKEKLYGGIYPFFWCDGYFIERLYRVLREVKVSPRVIKSRRTIDMFLTKEEAGEIIRRLK